MRVYPRSFLLGGILALYACIGFEDIVNVAEEVREAERNLPIAILAALTISTLLYLAMVLVAVAGPSLGHWRTRMPRWC